MVVNGRAATLDHSLGAPAIPIVFSIRMPVTWPESRVAVLPVQSSARSRHIRSRTPCAAQPNEPNARGNAQTRHPQVPNEATARRSDDIPNKPNEAAISRRLSAQMPRPHGAKQTHRAPLRGHTERTQTVHYAQPNEPNEAVSSRGRPAQSRRLHVAKRSHGAVPNEPKLAQSHPIARGIRASSTSDSLDF